MSAPVMVPDRFKGDADVMAASARSVDRFAKSILTIAAFLCDTESCDRLIDRERPDERLWNNNAQRNDDKDKTNDHIQYRTEMLNKKS